MNLSLEDLIKRIKVNSRLKFKNDNHYYYSKNISVDQKNIFVTLNGLQTYRKALKNLIQVDNYDLNKQMKNLKETIKKVLKEENSLGSTRSSIKIIKNAIESYLEGEDISKINSLHVAIFIEDELDEAGYQIVKK